MTTAFLAGLCPWCAQRITSITEHPASGDVAQPCGHTLPPPVSPDSLDIHRLTLPYPHYPQYPNLSLNARTSLWARNSHVQAVRYDVKTLAQHAGIKPGQHVIVHLAWSPKRRAGQDEDNLSLLFKACCDALARGKRRPTVRNPGAAIGLDLVPSDEPRYMTKLMPVILPKGEPPGMWLTVAVLR